MQYLKFIFSTLKKERKNHFNELKNERKQKEKQITWCISPNRWHPILSSLKMSSSELEQIKSYKIP